MPEHRCRLCTSNDRDALVETLASEMWASRRDREIDPPWEDCGSYWQQIMREFAWCTVRMLAPDHG